METQPSRISFLDLDMPRPLQIVKRAGDSRQLDMDASRKLSWQSSNCGSDESQPEPLEGLPKLSIPKRRTTSRNIRATAAFQELSSDSGYNGDVVTPEQSNLDEDVEDTTPKPRRSTSDMSPRRVPKFVPSHAVTSKASMMCLRGKTSTLQPEYRSSKRNDHQVRADEPPQRHIDPDEGAMGGCTSPDPFAGYLSTPPTSRISSSNFDISEANRSVSRATSFLLAPRVVVTPETKTVDDGVSMF